jgi:putative FmdB family regulatory protein
MPQYSYRCRSCSHEFDEIHTVSDRKIPEEKPCPGCGQSEIYQKIGTPVIGYSVAPGLKTTDNFNSRLKEIKKRSGRDNTVGNAIR